MEDTNNTYNMPDEGWGYYLNQEEKEELARKRWEQYALEMQNQRYIKRITALVASVLMAQEKGYLDYDARETEKQVGQSRDASQNQSKSSSTTLTQVSENKKTNLGCAQTILENDTKKLSKLRHKAKAFCAESIDNIPLNYMVDYIKEKDDKEEGVSEARLNREIIWLFKHDSDDYPAASYRLIKDMIVSAFARQLYKCFGSDVCNVTLLPVPCSSFVNQASRWCLPMQEICDTLEKNTKYAPRNGYSSIVYTLDSKPEHYNKGRIAYPQVEFGKELRGANVVLLDDVSCSGNHIRWCKKELEALGAHVVAAFVIGKAQ